MANTATSLQILLKRLRSKKSGERLGAVDEISKLASINSDIARSLELAALNDENISVRQAAQKALRTSAYRANQAKRTNLQPGSSQTVASQIQIWKQEGLIDAELSQVLLSRYSDVGPSTRTLEEKKPKALLSAKKERPARSLSEVLLSETTIKIALFLGAFFILAAALILAALNASLRIPILVVVAAIFFAGALGLRRRLPTASLTLFFVYSLLVPITARVIINSLDFLGAYSELYWLFINAFLLVNWIGAIWQYGSKVFILLAFLSFNLLPFQISQIINADSQLTILLAVFANLLSIITLIILKRRKVVEQQLNFLFTLSQIWQIWLLASVALNVLEYSLLYSWLHYGESYSFLALGPACFLSGLYYIFSQQIKLSWFFASLAAISFAIFPWFVLNGLSAPSNIVVLVTWFWGSVFALSTVWFLVSKLEIIKIHTLPVLLASVWLYFVASIGALAEGVSWTFGISLGIAVVYSFLTYKKPRHLIWAIALFAYFWAYLAFYQLPLMAGIDIFEGFIFLVPTLAYFSLDLYFSKYQPKEDLLQKWPRGYGLFLGLLTAMAFGVADRSDWLLSSIGYLILAVFFVFYSSSRKAHLYAHAAGAMFALALAYLLKFQGIANLTYPLLGLATIYYAGGWTLLKKKRTAWWARIIHINGLGLAAAVAIIKPGLRYDANWVFVLVFCVALYLAADLNANQKKSETKQHRTFIRLGVISLTFIGAYTALLLSSVAGPLNTAITFAAYGVLFLLYARFRKIPNVAYFSTSAFVATIFFIEDYLNFDTWLYGLLGLSLLYLLLSYLPQVSDAKNRWRLILRTSSLSVAALVSLAAISVGGTSAVICAALAASIFALEAYQQHSVRLAAAADLLYLEAYLSGLVTLNVHEPQYYSIGAAILGIVMHYMLVRSRILGWAFIAGIISQLLLLSTTYLQMFETRDLQYFFILFFQALAVMIYGIIIRSRSLVFVPIFFVVLSVITVIYSTLSGISTLVIIGCSGFVMLLLAIAALLLRERFSATRKNFASRLSGWSA